MQSPHEKIVIGTIEKVLPAVVSIVVGEDYHRLLTEHPHELMMPHGDHFDPPTAEEELPHTRDGKIRIGGGSGFFVDSSGLILTNKHVVSNLEAEYCVTTASEDTYTATVMARDPLNDIAILKITEENMPIIPLGDSDTVRLGQSVLTVGTALGEFQNSISAGIVSGLSRFISAATDGDGHSERLRGLIQTDAAINPGNSGGPLVNLIGQAIGINSAIVFGAQNLNFAIPVNKAKRDLEDVKNFGRIRRPFLGMRYVLVNDGLQKKFNLSVNRGVLILREGLPNRPAILPGSPADRAGVKEGDVILEVNAITVTDRVGIDDILEDVPIGDEITLKIMRKEQEIALMLKAEERSI